MRNYLFKVTLTLTTFFVSFYISPIRFTSSGGGIGSTSDLLYDCSFSVTSSNHFSSVVRWRCDYKNPETANEIFEDKINNASEIVEPVSEIKVENGKILYRAVIKIQNENLQSYCLVRTDGNRVDEIASLSLRHVREFEEQRMKY